MNLIHDWHRLCVLRHTVPVPKLSEHQNWKYEVFLTSLVENILFQYLSSLFGLTQNCVMLCAVEPNVNTRERLLMLSDLFPHIRLSVSRRNKQTNNRTSRAVPILLDIKKKHFETENFYSYIVLQFLKKSLTLPTTSKIFRFALDALDANVANKQQFPHRNLYFFPSAKHLPQTTFSSSVKKKKKQTFIKWFGTKCDFWKD